ncbi:hypothetical protein QFZ22_009551 [Streptomyces canus]|uniref:Uncharacterized protein n=1 Tax=Streptomyces canus TaxID=58343 RepID=A0AAW8FUE6_9ACTN|nr:hypothetical protein [Streptomyces canus]
MGGADAPGDRGAPVVSRVGAAAALCRRRARRPGRCPGVAEAVSVLRGRSYVE